MEGADSAEVDRRALARLATIETALDGQFPGKWRRLDLGQLEVRPNGLRASAGWRVELDPQTVACDGVDHLIVAIDPRFPRSQPRVVATQVTPEFSWPHVELSGVICLRATMFCGEPGQRIIQHLAWAIEVLSFSQPRCRNEFDREFSVYWHRRSSGDGYRVLSLLEPREPSRTVVWCVDPSSQARLIVAGDRKILSAWLTNRDGKSFKSRTLESQLVWLERPWTPLEFPTYGSDVLRHIATQEYDRVLRLGQPSPVFFGVRTRTGPVLAAVTLQSADRAELLRGGFRSLSRVPWGRVVNTFKSRPIVRCNVTRADASWVHGRDRDPGYRSLASRTVVIVGCGALGGYVARLLAQAGVAHFYLVDPDKLAPHNTSRHVLGHRFIEMNKAKAVATMLETDFPHIEEALAFPDRFSALSSEDLEKLATSDLVLSAGIDLEGDLELDRWRRRLRRPPVHVCTWVEAFAFAGHAVALIGDDSMTDAFDELENVRFRLTSWPDSISTTIAEAGCGNVFQPHGAVELQPTATISAELVLDVLLGKISRSMRRVWQGDPSKVGEKGGKAMPSFTESRCVKEFNWP